MASRKQVSKEEIAEEKIYPSLILGLDISTACIGISLVYDDGVNEPTVELITHVAPKIPKEKKGIEALILRKQIFEDNFLNRINEYIDKLPCKMKKVTECVIEAPMVYATSQSNANTVAQLLQFNGMLSEAVYRILGIIPHYITSLDARMKSFPELISVRKFNRKGEIYPSAHIIKALKDNHLVVFGSYPFDCDKKLIMMNLVSDKYPGIQWILDKKNELKKENYDSCDALVCALAYINEKRYGENMNTEIIDYKSEISDDKNVTSISYSVKIWDKIYEKKILL